MKWLKKNRFNLFTYLFCAFAMALFTIISFSCKTYAYTIDSNGNLVGDNLLSTDTTFQIGGGQGNFTRQNNQFILNVTAESDFYIYSDLQEFNPGTYTFSLSSYENIQLFVIATQNTWLSSSPRDYTFSFDRTENIYFRIDVNENYVGSLTIKFMINEGSTAQEWEPYGVWYSETNYDFLEDQYGLLQQQYQQLINENKYGFFNYVNRVNIRYHMYDDPTPDFEHVVPINKSQLISDGYISTGGIFNPNAFDGLVSQDTSINFTFILGTGIEYQLINFYILDNENYVVDITITDINENSVVIQKQKSDNVEDNFVTPDIVYNKFLENSYNIGLISSIAFTYQTYTLTSRVVSANNGSYQAGYDFGLQTYKSKYEQSLSTNYILIDTLNNRNHTIEQLQIAYDDLNTSYNNMLNGNNFANLFFTIAETPFASFKQIWSVDFLGVNLAGFVTGILFIGVLIWVVKKIF